MKHNLSRCAYTPGKEKGIQLREKEKETIVIYSFVRIPIAGKYQLPPLPLPIPRIRDAILVLTKTLSPFAASPSALVANFKLDFRASVVSPSSPFPLPTPSPFPPGFFFRSRALSTFPYKALWKLISVDPVPSGCHAKLLYVILHTYVTTIVRMMIPDKRGYHGLVNVLRHVASGLLFAGQIMETCNLSRNPARKFAKKKLYVEFK